MGGPCAFGLRGVSGGGGRYRRSVVDDGGGGGGTRQCVGRAVCRQGCRDTVRRARLLICGTRAYRHRRRVPVLRPGQLTPGRVRARHRHGRRVHGVWGPLSGRQARRLFIEETTMWKNEYIKV